MNKVDRVESKLTGIMLGIANQLKTDFDSLSSQIKHSGTKGSIREDVLIEFLRKHIPNRYAVNKGEIISSKDETSKQIDVIIYDREYHPVFYSVGGNVLVPSESVMTIIEVKSNLTKKTFKDAVENIKSVKNMDKTAFHKNPNYGATSTEDGQTYQVIPTRGYLFAYNTNMKLETLGNELIKLNNKEKINFVCILNKGVILYHNKDNNKIDQVPCKSSRIAFSYTEYTLPWFLNILITHLGPAWSHPTNISKYLGKIHLELKIDNKKQKK